MAFLRDIIATMRPRQWTKNLLVFAAILFAGKASDPRALGQVSLAFVAFCILSAAVYLLNDALDAETDAHHPDKRNRPVAAGRIPVHEAILLAVLCALLGLAVAHFVTPNFGFLITAVLYLALTTAYTIWLKHIVILDVLAVALGYVLRAVAGAEAISVAISPWLIICTLLLTLFISLAKRRSELILLENGGIEHRRILQHYSLQLLDQMIAVVTASTLVTYCLYTVDDRTIQVVGTQNLVYTIPFVIYGIFRYLYLMHEKKLGGQPDQLVLTDVPLLLTILLYTATVAAILYVLP
jgi:4-hydroxybenzoate polyprenyltransferase